LGLRPSETTYSAGSFFLSRIKTGARIQVTALPLTVQWTYPIGKNLFDLNWKKFRGDIFEAIGSVLVDGEEIEMRVLGFWNPWLKTYHWYATNLKIGVDRFEVRR